MDFNDNDGFEANRERDLDDILRELEGSSAKQVTGKVAYQWVRVEHADDGLAFEDGKLDETVHVRAQHRVNQMGFGSKKSGAREDEDDKHGADGSDLHGLPAQIHHKHSQSIISPSKSGHNLLDRPATSQGQQSRNKTNQKSAGSFYHRRGSGQDSSA